MRIQNIGQYYYPIKKNINGIGTFNVHQVSFTDNDCENPCDDNRYIVAYNLMCAKQLLRGWERQLASFDMESAGSDQFKKLETDVKLQRNLVRSLEEEYYYKYNPDMNAERYRADATIGEKIIDERKSPSVIPPDQYDMDPNDPFKLSTGDLPWYTN